MSEQDDRELWQRFKQASHPGSACPDFNSLAAFVDGHLAGTELERVELHLVGCKNCLEAVRAARNQTVAPRPVVVSRRLNALAWIGLAAACVLACVAGFEMGQGTSRQRSAETAMVMDLAPTAGD